MIFKLHRGRWWLSRIENNLKFVLSQPAHIFKSQSVQTSSEIDGNQRRDKERGLLKIEHPVKRIATADDKYAWHSCSTAGYPKLPSVCVHLAESNGSWGT
ncbi:hypothetical protein T12_1649 [Trichinella patagoniensis]|uniref:Uncharacterized protein n=1 Tax=Trichinella patagoniensis TaxID=990121 RepID=A0A0V0ZMI9_9BILA|nr:hypothetical protein T12_1649 [Trichinella patagoniensis]